MKLSIKLKIEFLNSSYIRNLVKLVNVERNIDC